MTADKKTAVRVACITIAGGVLVAIITGLFTLLKPSASPSKNQAIAQSLGPAFAGSQIGTVNVYNTPDNATHDAVLAFDRKLSNATTTLEFTTNEVRLLSRALKDLDERTSAIKKLPDGRTKFGGIVSGEPSAVVTEHNAAIAEYNKCLKSLGSAKFNQQDFAASFRHSGKAIKLYESSPDGKAMTTVAITPRGRACIYGLGAMNALFLSKIELADDWSKKAIAAEANPLTRTVCCYVLEALGRFAEAKKIAEEGLKSDPNNNMLLTAMSDIEVTQRMRKR